jgi:hypothetical protein
MATKRDDQAADYRAEAIARPFAEAAERSSTVSKTGEGQSGLRTERVVLQIAHWGEYSAAQWDFAYCLRPLYALESVRVVEDAAPAASGGGVIRDMTDILRSNTADADEKHAALSTLVEAVCPGWVMTPAASGGGEGEPVAYLIDGPFEKRAFRTRDQVYAYTRYLPQIEKQSMQLVPLYRELPQPRGWLTEEEREALRYASQGLREAGGISNVQAMKQIDALLARSSPPEVELPEPPFAHSNVAYGDWMMCLNAVKKAIAAAGVAVKEVQ